MMLINAYHNSHDLFYRIPFGAVRCGQQITFRLRISSEEPVESSVLRIWENDRELTISMGQTTLENPSQDRAADFMQNPSQVMTIFEVDFLAPNSTGLIWYYFVIRAGAQTYYYGNNQKKLGGEGTLSKQEPPAYQITVHKQMAVPAWYKRGVMYQVFVDRFFNDHETGFTYFPRQNTLLHANWSDSPLYIKDEQGRVTDWDFFGGTLQGVIEKLPYLQELGVSILYFNPIFDAPSNHKYDTADYHRIDPMFGDDAVFQRLLDSASQAGISVILDGVFSHTGSDSVYFNRYNNYPELGAYQSVDSPYYNWYKFKPDHSEYQSWWGVDSLPEVNETNPTYRKFIYGSEESVVSKWLNMGVAGWRLDVADELPDDFIQELRQAIKCIRPEAVLIGEVWEDASNKVSYGKQREYFSGDELDSTMNYPFRASFLRFLLGHSDSMVVHQEIMSLYENYPSENFMAAMNLIGSHDSIRILTLLGDAPPEQSLTKTEQRNFRLIPAARHLAVQRLKILSLVQIMFPGVPCIYYGDEAGVEGYADPYNRSTYPWGKEDKEIMDWYRRILRMHSEYEILQTGDFVSYSIDPDVYGFKRTGDQEEIIVLINRHSGETKTVDLTTKLQGSSYVDLISGEMVTAETLRALPIRPLSGRALYKTSSPYNLQLERSCGVLLHISSLPSSWGLGDLGKEAYEFVDFLVESGQALWQILPLNPAGVEDCPYQSESVFAGDPVFISLDHLIREGLLDLEETLKTFEQTMRLGLDPSLLKQRLKDWKRAILSEAYQHFLKQLDFCSNGQNTETSTYLSKRNYLEFQVNNQVWLDDYLLFRALKTHFGDLPWYDWEAELAIREPEKLEEYAGHLQQELGLEQFLQYTFFFQWEKLKTYALANGVQVIGDLPHFVAADSCDVWVNRNLFILDEYGKPAKNVGVPPDYFSSTGQLWGNPVYDWKAMAVTDYDWWKQRIHFNLRLFDYIRLDHFRGFEAYWEVDVREETAEKGQWIKGPGKRFFASMAETFGKCPFIVEDLGVITPEVSVLKQILGYPGVKVLQFTPTREILMNEEKNFVYYTGTHDNNTLLGWYEEEHFTEGGSLVSNDVQTRQQKINGRQACRELIEDVYLSQAAWVIVPMQDILGLGDEARMNVPGKVSGNWQWQLDINLINNELKIWLHSQAEKTKRLRSDH